MTTYKSDIKTISSSEEVVFGIISDLTNLKKLSKNPSFAEKAKDLLYDTDSCSFAVDGFGRVGIRIIERTPYSNIQMITENAPVGIGVEVCIVKLNENECTFQLLLNAQLPPMIKMMVGSKLQNGVNSIADLIAKALAPKI